MSRLQPFLGSNLPLPITVFVSCTLNNGFRTCILNNLSLVHVGKVAPYSADVADSSRHSHCRRIIATAACDTLGYTFPWFRDASSRSISTNIAICEYPSVLATKPSSLEYLPVSNRHTRIVAEHEVTTCFIFARVRQQGP